MVYRRRRRVLAAVAAVALAAAAALVARPAAVAARPGVVTSADGQPYAGDVTEDDRRVYIKTAGGTVTLDRRNVAKVDYAVDVDNTYAQWHAKLAATDVRGRMDLATWARDHGRADLALTALEEARQIDPANRDVALAVDATQRQMDLDRRRGRTATPAAAGATAAGGRPTTGPASTGPAAAAVKIEHRLLTMDEVNVVRQIEMRPDDRAVKVRFDNNVVHKYLLAEYGSATDKGAKMFARQSMQDQGSEIVRLGTPEMANSVRVVTDPTPLLLFKNKVMPVVAQGCGSVACHGGTKGGTFHLYEGQSTQAVYTNFYILMTYAAQVNGVRYLAADREVPDRSLVLQFGLPALQGRPPHPTVPELRARFKGRDDPAYLTISDWLTNDLRVIQPNYGFPVSPALIPGVPPSTGPATAPTTEPAATATTAPAARPPVHGTPLPRVSPGGPVTLPSATP